MWGVTLFCRDAANRARLWLSQAGSVDRRKRTRDLTPAGLLGSVQCQRSTSWSRFGGPYTGNKAGETLGGFADEQKIAEEC